MNSTIALDSLSNVYQRVLVSTGSPVPVAVGLIDSACIVKAARQYCEPLFVPQRSSSIIAGGFVRDSLLGFAPNDLDLYAPRMECARLAKTLELDGWQIRAVNSVVSTWGKKRKRVQLIEFSGSAAACVQKFDLTICCAALDLRSRKVICANSFVSDLTARRLVVHHPTLPLDTMRRVERFDKQGFTICESEFGELRRRIDLERVSAEQYLDTAMRSPAGRAVPLVRDARGKLAA